MIFEMGDFGVSLCRRKSGTPLDGALKADIRRVHTVRRIKNNKNNYNDTNNTNTNGNNNRNNNT